MAGPSVFAQHADHGTVPPAAKNKTGVLLLAHGGNANWDQEVRNVADEVARDYPVEVAFGMATKRNIQTAVEKLEAHGVSSIVAVPLFISSNSSIITSTQYLLGLRKEAPADLAIFARMNHGNGDGSHAGHSSPSGSAYTDPMVPISSKVPITMRPALDSDPAVAEILLSRASSISMEPKNEVLVLVAHGPVKDETNRLWLSDLAKLAVMMKAKSDYRRIDFLTVRDDAPEPIRSKATEEFREVVKKARADGARVLVVPLLLSFGGIEEGVRKRLDGLEYTMTSQALLPDPRIATWVRNSVKAASK